MTRDILINQWKNWLIEKIISRVELSGTPYNVPDSYIKRILLLKGKILFFKNYDEIIAYDYTTANRPDIYNRTETALVTFVNGDSMEKRFYQIGKDAVPVFSSQSAELQKWNGFETEINTTAEMLADVDLTINCELKNARLVAFATGSTNADIDAINITYEKMINGENIIASKANLNEVIKVNPLKQSKSCDINEYNTLKQNIINSFFENIGIKIITDKKERLVTAETDISNEKPNFSFINTIKTMQDGFKNVNEMFNINIKCNLIDFSQIGKNENENKEGENEKDTDDKGNIRKQDN